MTERKNVSTGPRFIDPDSLVETEVDAIVEELAAGPSPTKR